VIRQIRCASASTPAYRCHAHPVVAADRFRKRRLSQPCRFQPVQGPVGHDRLGQDGHRTPAYGVGLSSNAETSMSAAEAGSVLSTMKRASVVRRTASAEASSPAVPST